MRIKLKKIVVMTPEELKKLEDLLVSNGYRKYNDAGALLMHSEYYWYKGVERGANSDEGNRPMYNVQFHIYDRRMYPDEFASEPIGIMIKVSVSRSSNEYSKDMTWTLEDNEPSLNKIEALARDFYTIVTNYFPTFEV